VFGVADSHIRRFWTSAGRAQRAPYPTSGAYDVHDCMRPNRRARRRDGRWSGRVNPLAKNSLATSRTPRATLSVIALS